MGELSLWEFSGHEAYFPVYDHFIGNTSCVHLIVFPLNQPFDVQLQQCSFWMSFLQARIPPMEPLSESSFLYSFIKCRKSFYVAYDENCDIYNYYNFHDQFQYLISSLSYIIFYHHHHCCHHYCHLMNYLIMILKSLSDVRGKPSKAAKVALVGTHADAAQCHRNTQGEYMAPQVHLLQVCGLLFARWIKQSQQHKCYKISLSDTWPTQLTLLLSKIERFVYSLKSRGTFSFMLSNLIFSVEYIYTIWS